MRPELLQQENFFYFGIGHSNHKSETFLPAIVNQEDMNITWIDIAGLNDTSGALIHLINSFVTKEIFMRAAQVKFLVPITPVQVKESKGQPVREQIQVLQNLCAGFNDKPIDSILPVMTKVKVNEADFDLLEVQSVMAEQIKQEVQKQKTVLQKQGPESLEQDQFATDEW